MADDTGKITTGPEPGPDVVRAIVNPDGIIQVPCCEADLVSVEVADVDLLLGFADGTYVIIPNGALDALSEEGFVVDFTDKEGSAFSEAHYDSDHLSTLSELFKMVGVTKPARAGSLRVRSENIDDEEQGQESGGEAEEPLPPPETTVQENAGGKGPGSDPILSTPQLLDPLLDEPSGPRIEPRPSVFKPGQVVASTDPVIWLDGNIAGDGVINIAESASTVTISGSVGGSAIVGDSITVTVLGVDYNTVVLDGMIYRVDIPGNVLAPVQGVETSLHPVDARIDTWDGKTDSINQFEFFDVDTKAPVPTILLDPVMAGDNFISSVEAAPGETVRISGQVSDVLPGDTVTLTLASTGATFTGQTDGATFNIDVLGSDLIAAGDGGTDTITASIFTADAAGNQATAADNVGVDFSIDLSAPVPEIYLDAVTGDNLINQAESVSSAVAITGRVAGGAQLGDQVDIYVNGTVVATGYVGSDLTFSINVDGSDLATVGDGNSGNVMAEVTTAGASGSFSAQTPPVSYTVDLTSPSPTIIVDNITGDDIVNIAEAGGDIAVTGSVSGGQPGDTVTLTVNNVDYSGLVRSDGTFSINVLGSDLVDDFNNLDQSLRASTTTYDLAGNPGSGTFDKAIDVDDSRPTATIFVDDAALNIGDDANVTITFSEPVFDFTEADLIIENGTLSGFGNPSGDNQTWTAILTPDAPIEVPINVVQLNNAGVYDAAGNFGTGTTDSNPYAVDTIEPSVSTVSVDKLKLTDAEVGQTLSVTVTFNEPMNQGVAPTLTFAPDVTGASLSFSSESWSGGGTTYTAVYNILDDNFEGSITVDVTGAVDAAGNPILDYTEEIEFVIDTLNPSVSITHDNDGVVNADDNIVTYTLAFSEEVAALDPLTDLSLTGIAGVVYNDDLVFDGTSATFSVTIPLGAQGDLSMTVLDSVVDLNGNPLDLTTSTSTLPVDTLNPLVTIGHSNLDGVVSDEDIVVNYTLTFTQDVTFPVDPDTNPDTWLDVQGGAYNFGSLDIIDGQNATFSVTAADGYDGDMTVTILGTIVDAGGRPLIQNDLTLTVDTVNAIADLQTNHDYMVSPFDPVVDCTITFSEDIVPFTEADIDVVNGFVTPGSLNIIDGQNATFSVTAADDVSGLLTVTVSDSVVDLNGNPINTLNGKNTFTLGVDTQSPSPLVFHADTRISADLITDANVGTNLIVSIYYSELMDQTPALSPTITFSSDVSGSLTKVSEVWVSSGKQLLVNYSISDANIDLSTIDLSVSGGQDVHGNLALDANAILNFGIDTLNPYVLNFGHNNADGTVNDDDKVVEYTLTFNEKITSFADTDLSITGGSLTSGPILEADGVTVRFSVTADDESTDNLVVAVNNTVTDENGNPLETSNPANTNTLPVDTVDYFPYFEANLYTSSEFKVVSDSGSISGLPTGAYDPAGTKADNLAAASPAGQAAREQLYGTSGSETIDHNSAFSLNESQWVKTMHIDFKVFDTLDAIQIVLTPEFASIPGFEIYHPDISYVGLDGSGNSVWSVTPDAAMITDGLDLDIRYSVSDTGGPIDFDMTLNVDGYKDLDPTLYNWSETFDFSWRDAVTEAEFDIIDGGSGNQVMILPREGLGVDIYAGAGADTVRAGAGDDTIYGEEDNDFLYGGSGDDTLIGGAGNDLLDGEGGSDTASYVGSTSGIVASLAADAGLAGDAAGDTYVSIENLTGGSGNDILIADDVSNVLDGGAGEDTASYAASTGAVTASLASNSGTVGDAAGDTYINIENLTGGSGNDTLTGDSGSNVLEGGAGGDILQGGGGSDTVSFAGATSGVMAALDPGLASFMTGDAAGDTYSSIENLLGSNQDDFLFGDSNANRIDGGLGNDTLSAGAGDDTIYADQGSDTVNADLGNDVIHVSADGANTPTVIDGGDDVDTIVLENMIDLGSGSYDLTPLADVTDNVEQLDIRDGTNSEILISGVDIQNMVGSGGTPSLLILADSGDVLTFTPAAGETISPSFTIGADDTYTINDSGGNPMAQIIWDVA